MTIGFVVMRPAFFFFFFSAEVENTEYIENTSSYSDLPSTAANKAQTM